MLLLTLFIFLERELEKLIHPDLGQNEIDRHAYALEVSESRKQEGKWSFTGFGHHCFFLGNHAVGGSLFVSPDLLLSWNSPATAQELKPEHFDIIDVLSPPLELVLIGTGEFTEMIPEEVKDSLRPRVPCEAMATFAAASSYNMLSAEGRRVAAFLISAPETDD